MDAAESSYHPNGSHRPPPARRATIVRPGSRTSSYGKPPGNARRNSGSESGKATRSLATPTPARLTTRCLGFGPRRPRSCHMGHMNEQENQLPGPLAQRCGGDPRFPPRMASSGAPSPRGSSPPPSGPELGPASSPVSPSSMLRLGPPGRPGARPPPRPRPLRLRPRPWPRPRAEARGSLFRRPPCEALLPGSPLPKEVL